MIGISLHKYQELESIKAQPTRKAIPSGCVVEGCAGKASVRTAWLCLTHRGSVTQAIARDKRRELITAAPEDWTSDALKIADFYDIDPRELFPESVRNLRKSSDEKLLNAEELDSVLARQLPPPPPIPSPQRLLEAKEVSIEIQKVLEQLPVREQFVISCRFGLLGVAPMTLEEVGACYKVNKERIRQIENSAMRKLRHPSVSRRLHELLETSAPRFHLDNELIDS